MLTLAPGRLVKEACAGSGLLTPFAVVTALAGMIFVRLPLTVMVTLRVSVQLPPGGRLPPLNEKEFAPGAPLSVPPQAPTLKFSGLARIMPVPGTVSTGMLSVNVIAVSATLFGLIKWMLIVDAEPPKTVNGSKPLTRAMARLETFAMLNVEVRAFAGLRFSLLVMFSGGIVLV